jgi:hypothetical protein
MAQQLRLKGARHSSSFVSEEKDIENTLREDG